MNFDFSDDQKFLKEQANKFLSERCDTSVVRKTFEGDQSYDPDLWKSIVEMGWTGTSIPEEYGGLGLGHLELCVIAEELGRSLAPTPFASSVYLATEALILAGSDEQKQTLLPKLATGDAIGTFALAEGPRQPLPKNLTVRAEGGKIWGVKTSVPDGDVADFAIVAAKTSNDATDRSVSLFLVDLKGAGVTVERAKSIDPARSQATITFDGAVADPLGATGEGWALTRSLFDRAAILFAFEQVGGADACLEMAKAYALERYAFGRLIGSYQAVKHKLADMYINTELARSNAYYGAWALSTGAPELSRAAAGARVSACKAYAYAAEETIQTHGGVGFTWEYDCHLYYKRARLLAANIGSARVWKDQLVTQLEQQNAA
jgi:alkylation response protein AidB-like acyl-CoA dehydrogenase